MPEEYGGGGMSLLARAIVWEELSRTIALPARGEGITGPSARGILYSLKGEMKEKYLLPVLRGEKKACFAQTEPDAGSDPGGMRTTAVQDGNHYVINGVKRFITGADKADFMQLMAATDRSQGLARRHLLFHGRHGHAGREARRLLPDHDGRPAVGDRARQRAGAGHAPRRRGRRGLARSARNGSASAASSTARARSASPSAAWKWRRPTPSSARPSAGRSPTARRCSGCWPTCIIELQAARLLVYKAAARLDQGEEAREDAYVAKYYADEMAFQAADQCMQIHGGIALTTDLPIEKLWRQQRSYRITEGASEVMKMVIARHVLKTYG